MKFDYKKLLDPNATTINGEPIFSNNHEFFGKESSERKRKTNVNAELEAELLYQFRKLNLTNQCKLISAATLILDKKPGQRNISYHKTPKDIKEFSKIVKKLSNEVAFFKDENGENMGYKGDLLIIPANNDGLLELATQFVLENHDWAFIMAKDWKPSQDAFCVMSRYGVKMFCWEDDDGSTVISSWKFILLAVCV